MKNKWTPRENIVDLRVGLIGDSHIAPPNNPNIAPCETDGTYFREAVKAFSVIGKNRLDALAFTGDIVYQNRKEELYADLYDIVYDITDEHANGVPIIYTVGNHEFPQGSTDPEMTKKALELFVHKTGQALNYSTVISGYRLITAGCRNYYCDKLPDETENWIMEEIDSAIAENPKKPVFLLFHNPIPEVFDGIFNLPASYSDKLISFLKERPQVINICAHCHTPAQLPQNIRQDGFTSFHTPMCGGGCLEEIECDCSGHYHTHEACFLEVTGGIVKIYSIDLITGSYIGKPWEIDVEGIVNGTAEFNYTDNKKAVTNTPYFEKDDKIKVYGRTDSRVIVSFPRGKCAETGKLRDDFIRAHRIIITEKDTGKEAVNVLYQADFWDYAKEENVTWVFDNLHYETEYKISVAPMSPMGIFGEPITAEFRTK